MRTAPSARPAVTAPEVAARLRLIATRLARRLRQESGATLSPSQQSALAVISNHGPLTLGALAELERVAPPSITKVVSKLESDGLVIRTPDPADRRVCRVAISPDGAALMEESRRRKTAWLTARISELDPERQRRLADALDVLDELIS
jgi:DNA-binding MarR family transcriptional regulator